MMAHTINCSTFDDRLSDYLEGELSPSEQRAVEAHLATCLRCTALVRELDAIRADASALPELSPSRDLWDGIAQRIEAPVVPLAAPASPVVVVAGDRRRRTDRVWLGAIAAALVAVTAGVTYMVTIATSTPPQQMAVIPPVTVTDSTRPFAPSSAFPADTPVSRDSGVPTTSGVQNVGNAPNASAAATYSSEIDRLRTIFTQNRNQLDPRTAAIIEANLKVIDDAIAQSRAALAQDPASRFLNDQLNNALGKKLELLKTAALLPQRTWMNEMRLPVILGAIMALGVLQPTSALAQRNRERDSEWEQAQSRIDTTFAFNRNGVVDLTQISGDVIVTAWERGEARVRAYTERGRVRWDLSSSRISLDVERVRGRVGDTRFELSVPVGVRVVARSTSGDVSVRGTRGPVEARSTSGDVEVSEATERVVLESVSGDVRASQLSGAMRIESVSGTIEARGVTGDVHAETTSGDVSLTEVTSKSVTIATVSGEVEYDGNIDATGRYEFRSHSGDVRLEIPENSSAQFSVQTYSGSLDTEFPLTLQPGQRTSNRPRRFEFTLGSGSARVTAESFSGDIVLTRRARSSR